MFNPNDYPIMVRLEARVVLGGEDPSLIRDRKGYYSGNRIINLNVKAGFYNGSFGVPEKCVNSKEELTIEIRATVTNNEGNEYKRLPESWTYMRDYNEWFFEPAGFTAG